MLPRENVFPGDSLGLTPKAESELGLMALGGVAGYLREALIDQVGIIVHFLSFLTVYRSRPNFSKLATFEPIVSQNCAQFWKAATCFLV